MCARARGRAIGVAGKGCVVTIDLPVLSAVPRELVAAAETITKQ